MNICICYNELAFNIRNFHVHCQFNHHSHLVNYILLYFPFEEVKLRMAKCLNNITGKFGDQIMSFDIKSVFYNHLTASSDALFGLSFILCRTSSDQSLGKLQSNYLPFTSKCVICLLKFNCLLAA